MQSKADYHSRWDSPNYWLSSKETIVSQEPAGFSVVVLLGLMLEAAERHGFSTSTVALRGTLRALLGVLESVIPLKSRKICVETPG